MLKVKSLLSSLRHDKRGVTAVEYGIMASLIATILVAVVTSLGGGLTTAFTNIATHLSSGK